VLLAPQRQLDEVLGTGNRPAQQQEQQSGKGYSTFAACLGSRRAANCVRNGTAAAWAIGRLQKRRPMNPTSSRAGSPRPPVHLIAVQQDAAWRVDRASWCRIECGTPLPDALHARFADAVSRTRGWAAETRSPDPQP